MESPTNSDDLIIGGTLFGNHVGAGGTLDGREGIDTLIIYANSEDFEITISGETVTIKETGIDSFNGADSGTIAYEYEGFQINLTNIEKIAFADTTILVSDLTSQSSPTGKPADSNMDSDHEDVDDGEVDDNTLSDVDLWANEFDANSISLPETVTSEAINETIDLEGFLGFESDSLGLNFDAFAEDSVVADIQPVKIVPAVTYHAAMEYHENSSIEDLVYSSELG